MGQENKASLFCHAALFRPAHQQTTSMKARPSISAPGAISSRRHQHSLVAPSAAISSAAFHQQPAAAGSGAPPPAGLSRPLMQLENLMVCVYRDKTAFSTAEDGPTRSGRSAGGAARLARSVNWDAAAARCHPRLVTPPPPAATPGW